MSEFLDRISKLSPQRLALLADELNERVQAAEKRRKVPLAIVGIGCRLPGGVRNAQEFWKLLCAGRDAVREVPRSRWDVEEFYDPIPDTPGKMDTRWGGFIDDPDQFDPKFFGIAPAEATSMDPQQRLLLETSWEALEDAGIAPSSLSGTLTGVYVGICNGDYSQLALAAPREQITPHLASGLSHAVAAGRISYVLGLRGPSMAVDTSCSASLVAVHLACQSLRLGECDTALAGGVNLILSPDVTVALSQSRMMAPDGRCKTFSDKANGFVRGEGCGLIVLKRLPDAVRDRNRILAVVRGSACNQDGRSNGLTAPNGPSQEAVIAAALADAGLRSDDIGYIEAHGTGTALGDPIELGALNAVFANRTEAGPLYVGSVKTNLGHLESAAGIAGLIKLVLSIQHGKIPPSLHFETPNHRVEWDRLPLQVATQLQDWKRAGGKRAGGVSSFGFSGTNAHVLVEEYVEEARSGVHGIAPSAPIAAPAEQPLLFPLSAKTGSALKTIASRLATHVAEHPSVPLADIARTLNAGRSHFEHRAAFVAASRDELQKLLESCGNNDSDAPMQGGRVTANAPQAAFDFGDAPHIRVDFARALYECVPVFREALMRCEGILRMELELPFTSLLYPGGPAPREAGELPSVYRQPAAVAVQFALAELWKSFGVEPAAVCGRSVGELAAACVAGVLEIDDALRMAVARSRNDAAVFEQRARATAYRGPRIPFVAEGEANLSDSAGFSLAAYGGDALRAAATSALQNGNCAVKLGMGNATMLQSVRSAEAGTEGKWLVSVDRGSSACRDFLNAAAALYGMGFDVDATRLYSNVAANTVSLPTYPFERERYWISSGGELPDPARLLSGAGHADRDREIQRPADDWVYELGWEPKPLICALAGRLEDGPCAGDSVSAASGELARIAALNEAATPIFATYILQALRETGLDPLPESAFRLDELSDRLKIAPNRRRILGRLFDILLEDRIVERLGDEFRFVDFQPRGDAEEEARRLAAEYPECRIEINILRRCGEKLSAVLLGKYDPMQLVFADGSIEETEQIYEKSASCRFFNGKTAEIMRAAVERLNRISRRPARILEIGAGTGATTSSVIAALSDGNIEYCFTDVSPVFLSRARVKFFNVPAMDYRILDIEKDPTDQNFEAGGYDIVLAANVLHATADMRRTVAHARKLLAPNGLAVLIEGVRPDRWLDLTYGLTDGWWHFADFDLRPKHPFMPIDNWTRVLNEAGLGSVRTVRYRQPDGELSQQSVIVAEANAEVAPDCGTSPDAEKRWLIFADRFGIGEALGKSLRAMGQRCEIFQRPEGSIEISSAFDQLKIRPQSERLEVVYLWGIDIAERIDSADALWDASEVCGKVPIHLMRSLLHRGRNGGRLSIATRGAQATETVSQNLGGAVQSLAWGAGRVFGLEAPEHYGSLVDLDPTASAETCAANLLDELLHFNREDQVAYRRGQRLVARLQRTSLRAGADKSANEIASVQASAPLRKDGSYLLVGGLGGVGLQVGQWAAEHHAGHIVLLGRTGTGTNAGEFATERKSAIQRMEKAGAHVTVVEGDVASLPQMKNLFRQFGGELPPLRGIFHCATVVGGAEIRDLTDSQIEEMLRPKLLGTFTLHELTKDLDLDFFLAFSSTSSLLGGKGMAHYAAANQFLDSFAHFRRAQGLPMLSVNWGAWSVLRLVSQQEQDRLYETGLLPMPFAETFDLFGDLIASPRAQVMIAKIDWGTLKPVFEAQRTRPLLENLGLAPARSRKEAAASVRAPVGLSAAAEMGADERGKSIETFVLEQAASVLGFRRGELPPLDVPLMDLGLDSLMAVDLKNRLQRRFGLELSPTFVFDYPTVSATTAFLETMLWAADGTEASGLAVSDEDEIRI